MSTTILINAVLGRWIWQQIPNRHLRLGAPLGMAGLLLLFWHDLSSGAALATLTGVGFAMAGSLSFSLGNMVSIRHGRVGLDTLTSNAWSMLYGCLLMLLLNTLQGQSLVFDFGASYIGALLYLALIASVLAFPVYLSLVARIGASSAAYVLVATPVLALTLSSWFEGYQWQPSGIAGVALILLGNVLVLAPAHIIDRLIAGAFGRLSRAKSESAQS